MMQDILPVGHGEPVQQVFCNGTSRSVYATNIETPFPAGELIVSRTNLEGIITMVNDAFVHMSGWEKEDLIGQPHHILRHPDMPSAAFQDLWTTVIAKQKWQGYVKNLRKDGGHYWVLATVIPNMRSGEVVGYTSVRREASRQKIDEISEQYREMKAQENG